jgi:hypothetical protein
VTVKVREFESCSNSMVPTSSDNIKSNFIIVI